MKRHLICSLALWCGFVGVTRLHGQVTAFTYQGRLHTDSGPAEGPHDLRFALFSESSGGSALVPPLTKSAVAVSNGVFTVLLRFGEEVFTGADRWLDIAVRPTAAEPFTPLSPRQLITPTPYALTARYALSAMSVPGLSGNALHAADGSPQNAVFVDNAGKVGIGATSPQEQFEVHSGNGSYVLVDSENGDIKVNGGSDGHFGIFNDGPATGGTHLIGVGQTRMFIANTGNVGIGTIAPAAKLEVQGEVRMGPEGRLTAVGSDEALRIVRGAIDSDGHAFSGAGFVSARLASGHYRIVFDPPFSFSTPPVTTANALAAGNDDTPITALIANPGRDSVEILLRRGSDGARVSRAFNFTVIGQPE